MTRERFVFNMQWKCLDTRGHFANNPSRHSKLTSLGLRQYHVLWPQKESLLTAATTLCHRLLVAMLGFFLCLRAAPTWSGLSNLNVDFLSLIKPSAFHPWCILWLTLQILYFLIRLNGPNCPLAHLFPITAYVLHLVKLLLFSFILPILFLSNHNCLTIRKNPLGLASVCLLFLCPCWY